MSAPSQASRLAASAVGWDYLVVFGSLVAFTAYSWLLGVAPVSQVATYAYVNPVVAVLLGALVADERVTATTVLGGAVTVLAVAVVVSEEGRRRRQDGPVADLGQQPSEEPSEEPSEAASEGSSGAASGEQPQPPDERQGRVRSSRT